MLLTQLNRDVEIPAPTASSLSIRSLCSFWTFCPSLAQCGAILGCWCRGRPQSIYEHNRPGFRVQFGQDRALRGKHPKIINEYYRQYMRGKHPKLINIRDSEGKTTSYYWMLRTEKIWQNADDTCINCLLLSWIFFVQNTDFKIQAPCLTRTMPPDPWSRL